MTASEKPQLAADEDFVTVVEEFDSDTMNEEFPTPEAITAHNEILENRRRAVKALREDTMEQCYSALFVDYHDIRFGDAPEVVKTQACAVGVIIKELFGIKTEAELGAYLKIHSEFIPYEAVAAKLGIRPDRASWSVEDDAADMSIQAIWMKNDRAQLSFDQIADWLDSVWAL